ncbi:glycosyltransferase family 25 protein [Lentisphaera profundi]|uniref:Glycosyltransferase family 25 protein n=1 Tax=Lentisphaera profundi TaxID=1658616 RepID=A0ABY7W2D1_9BACT|nr:glycosyltransferase family 25 protein [Lentisphaera profundi]WDE99161.1 glycosyltransferase family 25 protein [Lentisphaera profundi]
MIKTYVLSMEKEIERRASLVCSLKDLGVDYELFDAVDGKQIGEDHPEYHLVNDSSRPDLYKRILNAGEKGCFISHYRLWKKLIDSDDEWMCVLESDAQPMSSFKQVLKSLSESGQNTEYVMLNYSKCWPSHFGRHELVDNYNLVRFANKRTYFTSAYLLRRSGAQKLLDLVKEYKVCMPVDDFITGGRLPKTLNTWAVYPRVVELSALAKISNIYLEGEKEIKYEKKRGLIARNSRKIRIFFTKFTQRHSL